MEHLLTSDEVLEDLEKLFQNAEQTLTTVSTTPMSPPGHDSTIVTPAASAAALMEHPDPWFHKVAKKVMALNPSDSKGKKRKAVPLEDEDEDEEEEEVEDVEAEDQSERDDEGVDSEDITELDGMEDGRGKAARRGGKTGGRGRG